MRSILLLAAWLCAWSEPLAATDATGEVVLRGQVICLPEEMHAKHGAELPTGHAHVYAFKTESGVIHTLLRTRFSEAIFADERFRQRKLVLRVRLFADSQAIEVMNIKSLKDGVVHDIFYFCHVCTIYMAAPTVCECCQGVTELQERPVAAPK